MIALINDVTPTSQVPSATFTTASSTPFVSVEYEKNLGSRSAAHPCEETVSQFENSEDGGKLQTYFGRKQRCHPYIRFVRHSKWDSFMFISLRRLIATQSRVKEIGDEDTCTCRPRRPRDAVGGVEYIPQFLNRADVGNRTSSLDH